MRRFQHFRLIAWLAAAALGVGAASAQEPTRAEANAMKAKLERVQAAAETPRKARARPLRTSFSEREINAYLAHEGDAFLPAGIASPRVRLDGDGRVVARATVDLDAVRRSRERSLFDPLRYLTGSVEVVTAGTIHGTDSEGVVGFESAEVGGVSVPQAVAQELLRFYTRSPERPRGFTFDEPFPLPARLRTVNVERREVTVTQ